MIKPIWYFSVMGSNRGDQAIREGVKTQLNKRTDALTALFSCKTDLLDRNRINQLNKEGSMLLVAGSGLYSNYDLESGFYFRCHPKNFKHIKVPIALLSIGMNNHLEMDRFGELEPYTLKNIQMLNRLAGHTSTRDYRTLRMLHELGIEKARFVPDPAMFCPKTGGMFRWTERRLVGLSVAQHADMLKRHREKVIKLFINVCHELYLNGYTPIFISHDVLEHNIYEDLKQGCPHVLYYSNDSPKEMMALYEKCEFTIGVRCHSNIMSFGVNTPFICLAYDQKQIEFCKIAGVTPLVLSEKLSFNQVIQQINYIQDNYVAIKHDMSRRWVELYRNFDATMDEVTEMIK